MTFREPTRVYGLRLRGTDETRYIGASSRCLKYRLKGHFSRWLSNRLTPLADWALSNRRDLEVFTISEHETRAEGWAAEKRAIAEHLAAGHRLFNIAHAAPRKAAAL